MAITEYVSKMRSLSGEMAATRKPLNEEEIIAYILNGLDPEFNPLVSAVMTRVELISVAKL